jgi:hypothetical protein
MYEEVDRRVSVNRWVSVKQRKCVNVCCDLFTAVPMENHFYDGATTRRGDTLTCSARARAKGALCRGESEELPRQSAL